MRDTILIVEDDPETAKLIKTILAQLDYNIIMATDGLDGLEKYKTNEDRIKLVITDELMPRMNGTEMIKEIRKIVPDIPVIFSTGVDHINFGGGHMYLNKPFSITDLCDIVKTIMVKYRYNMEREIA